MKLLLIFLILLVSIPLFGQNLYDGLIAYYPFNGNANDESGNGHGGTLLNGPILTYGIIGQAFEFDGIDDQINIGNDVKPNFPATICAWVWLNSIENSNTILRTDQVDGCSHYFGMTVSVYIGGRLSAFIGNGGIASPGSRRNVTTIDSPVTIGKWHHIVAVFNSANDMRLFVDAQEYSGEWGGSATTVAYSSADAIIAADYDCGGYSSVTNGKIDELRVYNRALSVQEIEMLYQDRGMFTRITTGDIVNDLGITNGAAWGDFNNDNFLDLIVLGDQNSFLYKNNQNGTFERITGGELLEHPGFAARSAAWADYDNDGDLDIMISKTKDAYDKRASNYLFRNDGNGSFYKLTNSVIPEEPIEANGGVSWGDYNRDGLIDLFITGAKGGSGVSKNLLFFNNGNDDFIKIIIGDIVNDLNDHFGCNACDYDNDGDLDVFVSNSPWYTSADGRNALYVNDGNGNFTRQYFQENSIGSVGGSWGDYDNDGDFDLFVASGGGEGSYKNDYLYRNDGNGILTRITNSIITNDNSEGYVASWIDYDNDGWLDLYVTNRFNQAPFLYKNDGNGSFIPITNEIITENDGLDFDSHAWGDYDNDGFLDLFTCVWHGEKNRLYHNEGNNNNWIYITLEGTSSNRSGIGAKIRVNADINGTSIWQLRQIESQSSFRSANQLAAHFGLGNATQINEIIIEWPSGVLQTINNLNVNQQLTITEIQNDPPTISSGGTSGVYTTTEGSTVELMATGSDPNNDPLTYKWDLNNDGIFETPGQTVNFSAENIDGPATISVSVQATDPYGASATASATIEVQNVPPVVGEIFAPIDPVQSNTEITATSSFTDAGIFDTHTAEWDWGDGNTSTGVINESNGSGTVTGNHIYTIPGVYTVTLTLTDDDGGIGQSVFQYIVIFDPSAGFITGGGWIDSPEGAYIPDPTLIGRARFGFQARYKKGVTVPSGQTQFNFKSAVFDFESIEYQWLVIAGPHAKFKGVGTINGTGDYKFMVTATDGDLINSDDKFRIKISDLNDMVVYDNQMGDDDNAQASQILGGGNISVHSTALLPNLGQGNNGVELDQIPTSFSLKPNYPNPFNPSTVISFDLPEECEVVVRIFNILGEQVGTLVQDRLPAGSYDYAWYSGSLASGVYIYRLEAGNYVEIKKMILMR